MASKDGRMYGKRVKERERKGTRTGKGGERRGKKDGKGGTKRTEKEGRGRRKKKGPVI